MPDSSDWLLVLSAWGHSCPFVDPCPQSHQSILAHGAWGCTWGNAGSVGTWFNSPNFWTKIFAKFNTGFLPKKVISISTHLIAAPTDFNRLYRREFKIVITSLLGGEFYISFVLEDFTENSPCKPVLNSWRFVGFMIIWLSLRSARYLQQVNGVELMKILLQEATQSNHVSSQPPWPCWLWRTPGSGNKNAFESHCVSEIERMYHVSINKYRNASGSLGE